MILDIMIKIEESEKLELEIDNMIKELKGNFEKNFKNMRIV